nr:YafY family protein [Nocardia crassostreae]
MPETSAWLLSLLSLLPTRPDWPSALLAECMNVSARTVRRDMNRLRELGYPIEATKGPDGGYRLGAGSRLPPLLFDEEQAVALALALQVAVTTGAGIEEAAARALTTVRQVMPTRLRRRIDTVRVTPVEDATTRSSPQVESTILSTLSAAVHAHDVLRFDYAPASPPASDEYDALVPPRRVEPHHLVTWDGRWYLVAWDLDKGDWRTFRADRISPRSPTGPRFTPRELPSASVADFVSSRFQGTDASGDWPCCGEALLHLPAAAVSPYLRGGLVEELESGRCRVTLGSWSWHSLAVTIAAFDARIEVIGPDELRTAFAHLAERCATASGRTPDQSQCRSSAVGSRPVGIAEGEDISAG